MSKIGKKNIIIPAGVEVKIDLVKDAAKYGAGVASGQKIGVKGPKGELSYTLLDGVKAEIKDNEIEFSIDNDEKKNLWGLSRTLVDNMIVGVTNGYEKKLLVTGVGYTAKKEGNGILFTLGLSHKVKRDVPANIKFEVEQDQKGNFILTFQGIDKQGLGEFVAKLRSLKEPEPYKGKGIRYFDEFIKLKPGKVAKKA